MKERDNKGQEGKRKGKGKEKRGKVEGVAITILVSPWEEMTPIILSHYAWIEMSSLLPKLLSSKRRYNYTSIIQSAITDHSYKKKKTF